MVNSAGSQPADAGSNPAPATIFKGGDALCMRL